MSLFNLPREIFEYILEFTAPSITTPYPTGLSLYVESIRNRVRTACICAHASVFLYVCKSTRKWAGGLLARIGGYITMGTFESAGYYSLYLWAEERAASSAAKRRNAYARGITHSVLGAWAVHAYDNLSYSNTVEIVRRLTNKLFDANCIIRASGWAFSMELAMLPPDQYALAESLFEGINLQSVGHEATIRENLPLVRYLILAHIDEFTVNKFTSTFTAAVGICRNYELTDYIYAEGVALGCGASSWWRTMLVAVGTGNMRTAKFIHEAYPELIHRDPDLLMIHTIEGGSVEALVYLRGMGLGYPARIYDGVCLSDKSLPTLIYAQRETGQIPTSEEIKAVSKHYSSDSLAAWMRGLVA